MPFWGGNSDKEVSGEVIGYNLREALDTLHVDLGEYPSGARCPGPWIARGVSTRTIPDSLRPRSGQYGTWGVFFSDNLSQLITPTEGFIFFVNSSNFSWVGTNTDSWNHALQDVARLRGLDLATIKGGYEAETYLYKCNNVYQPDSGIATLCNEFDIRRATYKLHCQQGQVSRI